MSSELESIVRRLTLSDNEQVHKLAESPLYLTDLLRLKDNDVLAVRPRPATSATIGHRDPLDLLEQKKNDVADLTEGTIGPFTYLHRPNAFEENSARSSASGEIVPAGGVQRFFTLNEDVEELRTQLEDLTSIEEELLENTQNRVMNETGEELYREYHSKMASILGFPGCCAEDFVERKAEMMAEDISQMTVDEITAIANSGPESSAAVTDSKNGVWNVLDAYITDEDVSLLELSEDRLPSQFYGRFTTDFYPQEVDGRHCPAAVRHGLGIDEDIEDEDVSQLYRLSVTENALKGLAARFNMYQDSQAIGEELSTNWFFEDKEPSEIQIYRELNQIHSQGTPGIASYLLNEYKSQ